MFFSIAYCTIGPEITATGGKRERLAHTLAFHADTILAIALLIIGALATQYGFLSVEMQYAFIGAGTAGLLFQLIVIGYDIKDEFAPNAYIIPAIFR